MKNDRVFMVTAGLLTPKKENNILNKRNLYPNYGLISLASVLKNKGYSSIVIHGDYKKPEDIIELMFNYGIDQSAHPILLSLPSFFSIEWAQIFCQKIKKKLPNKELIVGGKWVVDGNQEWLKNKLIGIKRFVSGNAEDIIEKIINNTVKSNTDCSALHSQSAPQNLNYELVHEFKRYQPSIEIARGCGQGCTFCLESKSPYQLINSPLNAVNTILKLQKSYGSQDISPYFQASFFHPKRSWCLDFYKYYMKFNLSTKWRTQTRVDSLSQEKIELLSKSGLKVLDLGLESANPQQIKAMGKSNSPDKYLKQASQLLRTCYENGVSLKLNILLYAGETLSTIKETKDWIEFHKKFIKGISINPLFIYRYDGVDKFLKTLNHAGAAIVQENSLSEFGYAHLNLSDEVSFEKANELSLEIRREIVSDKNYFELKSFSYFDRFYSATDFKRDVKNIDDRCLPFYVTDYTK